VTAHQYPFFDHPGPLAFAHRGGARYAPNAGIENSLRAFGNAVELGYRYLETDVHATADGVLVAFHDPDLERVTDRTGRIEQLPYAEVAKARIGGREPIPLLADVLGSWPDVRVNIDPKADSAVEPLVEVLRRTKAHQRVNISAFSQARIRRLRRLLGPDVSTGLGPTEIGLLCLPMPTAGHRLLLPSSPCLQVPTGWERFRLVTPALVSRAHALGKQVHVWTIDDADEIRGLLDLGVDGIITDRIDTLREVLAERGAWTT
jgi:glycerophosphoryl diester phosphodiesterase